MNRQELSNIILQDLREGQKVNIYDIEAYDKDGELLDYLPDDEICQVEEKKLFLSGYRGGILQWGKEEQCYTHYYYYTKKHLHIDKVIFSVGVEFSRYEKLAKEANLEEETFRFKLEGGEFAEIKP